VRFRTVIFEGTVGLSSIDDKQRTKDWAQSSLLFLACNHLYGKLELLLLGSVIRPMKTWLKYLELTKPRVTMLNIFVGIVTFVLAQFPSIDFRSLGLFFVVAYLIAGGCGALNCYLDKDTDKIMDRTSRRVIPTGAVSPRAALVFGVSVLSVGLLVSYTIFNTLTLLMISFGAFVYLAVYTLWLKRRTPWNVVIGGISGSFAALSGWTAACNCVSMIPVLIGFFDFLWTPGHLWSLAIRMVEQYRIARIPMLPVVFGVKRTTQYIFGFNMATVGFSLIFPILGLSGLLYLIVACVAGIKLLSDSYRLLVSPYKEYGMKLFMTSVPYLACVIATLFVDKIV
jgi:protoheme IX farnesyltransferase